MTQADDQRWLVELKQMRDRIDAEIFRLEQKQRSRDERKHSWQLIKGGLLTAAVLTLSGAIWALRQLRDHTAALAVTAATTSTGVVIAAVVLVPATERDARGEPTTQPQGTQVLVTPGPRETEVVTLAPTSATLPPSEPAASTSTPTTSSDESTPPSAPLTAVTTAPDTSQPRDQPSAPPVSTTEPSPTERPDENDQAERPDDSKHHEDEPHRCLRLRPNPGMNPHACLSAVGGVLHATT
ncbi:hypothetical protein ABT324_00505 [Saccharopolyspora sp. NPDC000359]|uniref:hypothetical protein n=1 Tax=Saccharopolyspora sp. NPDC000359 TaxID=3154251 RepID=UPI0033312E5D